MLIAKNPPTEGIHRIIAASLHKAAKWLKDSDTGDVWYWPAEEANHSDVAKVFGVSKYTKGISIPTEQ